MTDSVLEALRREFLSQRIGELILAEVRQAVRVVTPRYPPSIYAGVHDWADGWEDLVQDYVTEMLLDQRQLEHLMDECETIQHFRNTMSWDLRRLLSKRRIRTIIDNLLDRAKRILVPPRFLVFKESRPTSYCAAGAQRDPGTPTDEALRASAGLVASIPRRRPESGDRAPSVYSTPALEAVLELIGDSLGVRFTLRDVSRILENVLAGWIPGFLLDSEGIYEPASVRLTPEEERVVEDTIDGIMDELTDEQRTLVRLKLAGLPDEQVGAMLHTTRQTVANRRRPAFETIRSALQEFDGRVQDEAIARLSLRLTPESGPE